MEEDRRGTVSVFNGPEPQVQVLESIEAEVSAVATYIRAALADGSKPDEIGIFVRSPTELPRARDAVAAAGSQSMELSERGDEADSRISVGTMHLAKGLEFKAVIVMACDDEILPQQDRIEGAADEVELEDVYETERQLFYVACTRARDMLLVTGVRPGSEFIGDLTPAPA